MTHLHPTHRYRKPDEADWAIASALFLTAAGLGRMGPLYLAGSSTGSSRWRRR